MNFFRYKHTALAIICAFSFGAHTALAQDATPPPVDILPVAKTAETKTVAYDANAHTHPAINLTPDKSEIVRLDKPAGSIIVGNPNHLNILADTAETLILVPRQPGATHFTILDKDSNVIMQRHVIVGSPKEKYLRVRRSCAGQRDCQETSVFYCPDMCHEIILGDGTGQPTVGGAIDDLINAAETTTAVQDIPDDVETNE